MVQLNIVKKGPTDLHTLQGKPACLVDWDLPETTITDAGCQISCGSSGSGSELSVCGTKITNKIILEEFPNGV